MSGRPVLLHPSFQSNATSSHHYTNPVWAPDGEYIAFVNNQSNGSELWLMNQNGSEVTNLSAKLSNLFIGVVSDLTWSPDGRYLAFTQLNPGGWHIWKLDVSSSDVTDLTRGTTSRNATAPGCWLADGRIAFISDQAGNADIWMMNSDGSNTHNLTAQNENEDSLLTCSPDGRYIAYTAQAVKTSEVWVIDTSTLVPAKILSGGIGALWTSDSKRVATVERNSGFILQFEVPDPASIKILVSNDGKQDYTPLFWSKDGQDLFFRASAGESSHIFKIRLSDNTLAEFTDSIPEYSNPSLSPDGKEIIFEVAGNGNTDIWRLNIDGAELTNLTKNLTKGAST
jgi:TolB protein